MSITTRGWVMCWISNRNENSATFSVRAVSTTPTKSDDDEKKKRKRFEKKAKWPKWRTVVSCSSLAGRPWSHQCDDRSAISPCPFRNRFVIVHFFVVFFLRRRCRWPSAVDVEKKPRGSGANPGLELKLCVCVCVSVSVWELGGGSWVTY